VSVSDDGSLSCGSDDLEVQIAFDSWRKHEACDHEDGYLVSHHLGNIARIGSLRTELERHQQKFPIILSRVIYNGTHCGDSIPIDVVRHMMSEMEQLAAVHCKDPAMELSMREFETQMQELITTALKVGKPLVF